MPKKSHTKAILNDGKNQLLDNLNEDAYQARFIRNTVFRWVYIHLVNTSSYLFVLFLFYLATSKVLQNVDPIAFFQKTTQRGYIITVLVLTLICYWTDEMLQHQDVEGDVKAKKIAEEEDWRPAEKMWVEFTADVIRIIDYRLFICILDSDVFAGNTNTKFTLVRCALMTMWILFSSRKFIFWLNILVFQKVDKKAWLVIPQLPNHMGDIYHKGRELFDTFHELQVEAKKQGIDLKAVLTKRLA